MTISYFKHNSWRKNLKAFHFIILHLTFFSILISKVLLLFSVVFKDGDTCLLRAVRSRNVEAVQILLDKKAKVSACDKRGDTSLHIAMRARSRALILFKKLILPIALSGLRLGIFSLSTIPLTEWGLAKSTIIWLVRWTKVFPYQESITFVVWRVGHCGLWPLSHYQSPITVNVYLFNLWGAGALATGPYFSIGWSLKQSIVRGGITSKIVLSYWYVVP